MQTLISAEEIGAKLVEWYSCIIARDIEQSIESKELVDKMMLNLPEDKDAFISYGKTHLQYEKLRAHYNLIKFRHKLLEEEIQKNKSPEDIAILKEEAGATDGRLKYLYYFLTGQFESYQERYKSAIRAYKLAENLLHNINSIEKAEFYQRIGFCYYRLDQYELALNYIDQSIEIFKEDDAYEERALNSNMTRAFIATELNQFDKAEDIYQELLLTSKTFPATYVLVLRGIGLNRIRQNRYKDAKDYFLKAQSNIDKDSVLSAKNKYNLANVQYRLGEENEAKGLLDQAEEEALKYQLIEYTIRCLITRALYQHSDMNTVEIGLEQLKENDLIFEYVEILEEISSFYENKNDYMNSLKYLKMAYQNPTNPILID